jgi:transposase
VSTLSPRTASDTRRPYFVTPRPWHDDDPRWRDLEQQLPPDHLARCIDQAVARLDLAALLDGYRGTGSQPYPPDLLLKVVLYQARRGQHSPAAWHREATECQPVRWLLRGLTPSRSCWYAFRDRAAPLLQELNRQPLAQAIAAGLTPAERGALDGTTVAAQASRHKLVNEAVLSKRQGQLAEVIAADQAGATPAGAPAWMAKRPAGRLRQQQQLRRAQERLEALQARNRAKRSCKRKAPGRVVVSLSDPEAVAGRDKEGTYRPLYNVQVVDDLDSPFVLGYEVFAQQNDAGTLGPMLRRLRAGLGHAIATLLTDSAYAGGADLAVAAQEGAVVYAPVPGDGTKKGTKPARQLPKGEFQWQAAEQTYVCPQGHRLVYLESSRQKRSGTEAVLLYRYRCPPAHCLACPLQARCTPSPASGRTIMRSEHEERIEALRARMGTEEAQALYRQRKQTVELVNADWKGHRKLRRFSGRGLRRARCQVGLMVLAHNLLTLRSEETKTINKKTRTAPEPDVTTSPSIVS